MVSKAIAVLTLAALSHAATTSAAHGRNGQHQARKLIVDSDMLNFDDDPLAIGLANIFQSCNEIEIIGLFSSVSSRYAPPAMDALNTYYGHGNIPIAIQKPVDNSTIDPQYPQYPSYLPGLTSLFPEDIQDGSNTTDPVTLYRTLLASSADKSVTIAGIGFHNNLYRLLHSLPDAISNQTGAQLVATKVSELVVQGNPTGESFNFVRHNATYAAYVLTHWPGRVTYVPDDVGNSVWVGAKLTTKANLTTNPVAWSFATCIGVNTTHRAWDGTAMYYAIKGLDDFYSFDLTRGEIYFYENGTAAWNHGSHSRLQRSIVLKEGKNETLANRIENMLLWDPTNKQAIPCR